MTHIMLDLETMGTAAGCAIASIGAVAFDPVSGKNFGEFYRVVDLGSCLDAGLKIEAGTLYWWLKQGDAARTAIGANLEPLALAATTFCDWFTQMRGEEIWAHGANFDEPILAAAIRAVGLQPPWKSWNARDTRTLFWMFGLKVDRAEGTHHHALDDARQQAKKVVAGYALLTATALS